MAKRPKPTKKKKQQKPRGKKFTITKIAPDEFKKLDEQPKTIIAQTSDDEKPEINKHTNLPIPTQKQIDAEIKILEDYRNRVRATSAFGDDHRESIDAQIDVLREDLEDDDIYERFGVSPEEEADGQEQPGLVSQALYARQWLDGELDDGPLSESWKSLLVK
jgi:hypothetical protein